MDPASSAPCLPSRILSPHATALPIGPRCARSCAARIRQQLRRISRMNRCALVPAQSRADDKAGWPRQAQLRFCTGLHKSIPAWCGVHLEGAWWFEGRRAGVQACVGPSNKCHWCCCRWPRVSRGAFCVMATPRCAQRMPLGRWTWWRCNAAWRALPLRAGQPRSCSCLTRRGSSSSLCRD